MSTKPKKTSTKKTTVKKPTVKKTAVKASAKKASKSKGSSFNPFSYGISQAQWDTFSPGVKSVVSTLSSYSSVLAQRNQKMPTNLSKKTLKKLWSEAEKDPTIQKYYADDLKIGTQTIQNNVKILATDYALNTEQNAQNYIDQKKQLEQTAAQAGQTYSGFRKQSQDKLQKNYSDTILSSKNQLQSQLNTLEGQFEQTYGSKALANLGIGSINPGTNAPIGMQSNWNIPSASGATYVPVGGLAGTQAQQKLGDIEAKYESLIADKQSKNQLNAYIEQYQALNGMK